MQMKKGGLIRDIYRWIMVQLADTKEEEVA